MKFLLDVHIATAVARAIEADGHAIVRAALDYPTWTDERLLALAHREQLIIVTEDSDFTDLIYAFGMPPPPAIIYIRCEPDQQSGIVKTVLETIASGRLNGHMAVVRPASTRYRPLPRERLSNG